MPRPNPGPRLKLDPDTGIWQIHWTELGRSRKISTGTREAHVAQERFREFLLMETRQSQPGGFTVREAWEIYWKEHVEQKVVDKARLSAAWKRLEPLLGARRLRDLLPADFLQYARTRQLIDAKGPTVRRELSALEAAINHLIRTKRVNATDTPYIPKPDSAPPRDRWLTQEEVAALLEKARERRGKEGQLTRVERFVHIALRTGARKRSIETLRWSQVDFDRGLIDFNGGRVQTKKRRPVVPISENLRPILEQARLEATTPFVLDHTGNVRKSFETLLNAAQIGNCTPHILRHTFATHAAMAGVSLVDIARVLGNTVAMVEKVYSKWAPEYLRGAVDFASAKRA
jgi:integrase